MKKVENWQKRHPRKWERNQGGFNQRIKQRFMGSPKQKGIPGQTAHTTETKRGRNGMKEGGVQKTVRSKQQSKGCPAQNRKKFRVRDTRGGKGAAWAKRKTTGGHWRQQRRKKGGIKGLPCMQKKSTQDRNGRKGNTKGKKQNNSNERFPWTPQFAGIMKEKGRAKKGNVVFQESFLVGKRDSCGLSGVSGGTFYIQEYGKKGPGGE